MAKAVYNLREIERKLCQGSQPRKMSVFTLSQDESFVLDRRCIKGVGNRDSVDFYCKLLEGCGF